jgi:hypothetical protein
MQKLRCLVSAAVMSVVFSSVAGAQVASAAL